VDQLRKERYARNEAMAREVNERFGRHRFTCECGDADCTQVIELPLAIYKSIRADDRRFLVAPGHEIPEMEDLIVRHSDWAVVRKHDDLAHIVETT
jgi:hypothetical protein